jgi:hypothetical protein
MLSVAADVAAHSRLSACTCHQGQQQKEERGAVHGATLGEPPALFDQARSDWALLLVDVSCSSCLGFCQQCDRVCVPATGRSGMLAQRDVLHTPQVLLQYGKRAHCIFDWTFTCSLPFHQLKLRVPNGMAVTSRHSCEQDAAVTPVRANA